MEGFGVHTSMWTMNWDPAGAERTVKGAAQYKMDFIEIALLNLPVVDAKHTRDLLAKCGMRAVCSLGLPEKNWASVNPDGAIDQLIASLDKTAEMGAEALSGVTYGGIGQRTGVPPTAQENDNIARVLDAAAKHAKKLGIAFGIEPVNRYENHLISTGWQAKWMIEKVGADSIFIHLDTYQMNIEEKGEGTCDWDEIYATLAAIGFKGGLAMESFINRPPKVGYGLAVWRPVANNFEEVMDKGLPFLRNKAKQYRLI